MRLRCHHVCAALQTGVCFLRMRGQGTCHALSDSVWAISLARLAAVGWPEVAPAPRHGLRRRKSAVPTSKRHSCESRDAEVSEILCHS